MEEKKFTTPESAVTEKPNINQSIEKVVDKEKGKDELTNKQEGSPPESQATVIEPQEGEKSNETPKKEAPSHSRVYPKHSPYGYGKKFVKKGRSPCGTMFVKKKNNAENPEPTNAGLEPNEIKDTNEPTEKKEELSSQPEEEIKKNQEEEEKEIKGEEEEVEEKEESVEKKPQGAVFDMYKSYDPFSCWQFSLPVSFGFGSELPQENDEQSEEENNTVNFYDAYRSANSLFGRESLFPSSRPLYQRAPESSLLNELQDDAEEYNPKHEHKTVKPIGHLAGSPNPLKPNIN